MRRFIVCAAFLAWAFLMPGAGWAQSGAPEFSYYSYDQYRVIARIYEYSDYYGLTDYHRGLMLRIAYRETGFGLDRTGDFDPQLGRDLSVGVFQWREGGVWLSTPCYREYGLAGRWIEEADVACAAWAFAHNLDSHWYPWLVVRWLRVVPDDPRPWLWGGPHPPVLVNEQ
jgi:hypothetical protein